MSKDYMRDKIKLFCQEGVYSPLNRVWLLPSGAKYKVADNGAWVRRNHPRNKHERKG